MAKDSTTTHVPLDQLMVVRTRNEGEFSAWAESLVDLPAGALFTPITDVTVCAAPTYATVQAGRDVHIEFGSDLLYLNHSCAPTLECDTACMEIRVARGRALRRGDPLTFFYPSTEWTLAQPFDCWCGGGAGRGGAGGAGTECVGRVEGAAGMDRAKLRGYFLNDHIKEMLEEREDGDGGGNES